MTDTSSGAAVAGLAREIEALQRQTDDLPTLRKRLEDLAELVATLAERSHGQTAGSGAEGQLPSSWLALRGSNQDDQAETLLTHLLDWVEEVYLRFDDAALPECWLWHPGVVEELVWLMHAWRAAYPGDDEASATDIGAASIWHDRYRPGVAARLADAARGCSLIKHDTDSPGTTAPLREAGADVAAWWGGSPGQPPAVSDWHVRLADKHQQGGGHP